MNYTNKGKPIYPESLPQNAELLWMKLEDGTLVLDAEDRCQYEIASDTQAKDGRHSEEIPIVNPRAKIIVGVIHLHWDRYRNLQYMHVKEHMLGPGSYAIPFTDSFWKPIVRGVIQ